jgi:hypothetical protein
VGRRTLRGGAKGYCKNANRTSHGAFAERLVRGRDREGGDANGDRGGLTESGLSAAFVVLVIGRLTRQPPAARASMAMTAICRYRSSWRGWPGPARGRPRCCARTARRWSDSRLGGAPVWHVEAVSIGRSEAMANVWAYWRFAGDHLGGIVGGPWIRRTARGWFGRSSISRIRRSDRKSSIWSRRPLRPVWLPRVDPRGHPGRRIGPASAHRSQATRHVVNGVPFRPRPRAACLPQG